MRESITERGFARVDFVDLFGQKCSVQDSSDFAAHAIWLGVDEMLPGPVSKDPVSGRVVVHARMHLTREMAKQVIALLERFVETGSIGR